MKYRRIVAWIGDGLLLDFDRAERHDFLPRIWLFFSPFLVPPKKRGKKKRRMNGKSRDFK